jgi:hypothetical protein
MIRSRFLRTSVLTLSAFVALSCTDSPTAPTPIKPAAAGQDALLGGLLGGLLQTVTQVVQFVGDATGLSVRAVAWNSAYVHESHTVSATISPWGGTLTIPESDFTMTFPMGAVSQPTLITVTSDANYVAYKMQPQGIKFAHPVVVTQRLRKTAVYGQPLTGTLFGAYVSDDLLDLSGIIHALEIELSTTIFQSGSSTLPEMETWTINHFSRYMLASG